MMTAHSVICLVLCRLLYVFKWMMLHEVKLLKNNSFLFQYETGGISLKLHRKNHSPTSPKTLCAFLWPSKETSRLNNTLSALAVCLMFWGFFLLGFTLWLFFVDFVFYEVMFMPCVAIIFNLIISDALNCGALHLWHRAPSVDWCSSVYPKKVWLSLYRISSGSLKGLHLFI